MIEISPEAPGKAPTWDYQRRLPGGVGVWTTPTRRMGSYLPIEVGRRGETSTAFFFHVIFIGELYEYIAQIVHRRHWAKSSMLDVGYWFLHNVRNNEPCLSTTRSIKCVFILNPWKWNSRFTLICILSISFPMKTPPTWTYSRFLICLFLFSKSSYFFFLSLSFFFPPSFIFSPFKSEIYKWCLVPRENGLREHLHCVWVAPQTGWHFTDLSDAHLTDLDTLQSFEVQKTLQTVL